MHVQSFKFDSALSEAFLAFREELYRAESICPAAQRSVTMATFAPDFGFHQQQGNDHRNFIAWSNGRVVGHLTASTSPDRRDRDGTPVGAIGHLECIDDPLVSERLLDAARRWFRDERGITRIWGPLNFDIWHGYRIMTSGFGEAPFLGEPRNKPYYPSMFERAGFSVRHEWCSIEIAGRDDLEALATRSEYRYRQALSSGYRFRPIDAECVDERRRLYDLEMASFRGLLGYVPLSFSDFEAQFSAYARLISLRYFFLAVDPRGNPAGFSVAYPDRNDGVRLPWKEHGLVAWLRRVWPRQRGPERAVLYMIGVVPAESTTGRGLGRAIFYFTIRKLLDGGYNRILAALITNEGVGQAFFGDRMQRNRRTYALYQMNI